VTYIGLREDAVAVAKTDFIFISTGKFSVSGRLLFFQSLKCADRNLFRTRVVRAYFGWIESGDSLGCLDERI
jgi:hypothetical protein